MELAAFMDFLLTALPAAFVVFFIGLNASDATVSKASMLAFAVFGAWTFIGLVILLIVKKILNPLIKGRKDP